MALVTAYPVVAYRGWIGGIVSVDARHESRPAEPREASYHVVTLVLQLIPYSIAGGMGRSVEGSAARRRPCNVVVVPLLLVASLWEFLLR